MGADNLTKNTPNAPEFFCPSPKVLDFNEIRLHLGSVVCDHKRHSFLLFCAKKQERKNSWKTTNIEVATMRKSMLLLWDDIFSDL